MLVDCVFKVGDKNKWNGEEKLELKYAIRSVCKNFKNLNQIVIVGTKPKWFTGYHIPTEDRYKKNKDASIIEKLIIACRDNSLTSDIVQISDDQLFINTVFSYLLRPYTINSDIRRIKESKNRVSLYGERVINTLSILEKEGIKNPNLYEGHIPYLINRQKYVEILNKYNYYTDGTGYVGNTIYFNNIVNNGENPVENVRAFFKYPPTLGQIITECRGKLFLGYQKRALNDNLKNYFKQQFPEKSIYEK